MSNNVFEPLQQTIETIACSLLSEVSFDRTIACEIISQDEDDKSKYWVSDGTMKFEAYAMDDKRYGEGLSVYITIPSGDYNQKKLIIGCVSQDTIQANRYISPFEDLVVGRIAEGKNVSFNYIYESIPYEYIGVELSLNTIEASEEYIIKIKMNEGKEDSKEYIISSVEITGNPYGLTEEFKLSYLLSIPENTTVTSLSIEAIGENVQLINPVFYLGYDKNSSACPKNSVLYTPDNLKFNTDDENESDTKHFYLEIAEGNMIYSIYLLPGNIYNMNLLRYEAGYTKTEDDIPDSVDFWRTLQTGANLFEFIQDIRTWVNNDQYKIGIYSNVSTEKVDVGSYQETNIIEFTSSKKQSEEGATNNVAQSMKLELDEGDTGIYNLYGLDGHIIKKQTTHTITASFFDSAKFDIEKNENPIFRWVFPEQNTMILPVMTEEIIDEETGEIIEASRLDWGFNEEGLPYANFYLNKNYGASLMNNTIRCFAEFKSGEKRQASMILQFGYAQTSGTNYSLNLDFKNDTEIRGSKIEILPTFQRLDGAPVETQAEVVYSWKNGFDSGFNLPDENNIITAPNEITAGNFAILQGTTQYSAITNNKINLTAYLPMVMAHKDYDYITGPTRIIYDAFNITKNDDALRLYKFNSSTPEENVTWKLTSSRTYGYNPILAYRPLEGYDKIPSKESLVKGDNAVNSQYWYKISEEEETYIPIHQGNYDTVVTANSNYLYYYRGWEYQNYANYQIIATPDENGHYSFEDYIEPAPDGWNEDKSYTTTINYKQLDLPQFTIIIKDQKEELTILPTDKLTAVTDHVNLSAWVNDECVWSQPLLIIQDSWRYGLVNAWDGSLHFDEGEGSILSSLMVAGSKDQDNNFTGIIMGDIDVAGKGDADGLYGFQKGQNRFKLTENGEFFVGNKAKGKYIEMDSSGNVMMQIGDLDLTATSININTDNSNFILNSDTKTFKMGNFKYENQKTTIGNWNIDSNNINYNSNQLYFGTTDGAALQGDFGNKTNPEVALKLGNNFGVTADGILYAADGYFKGDISGAKGTFTGGIYLDDSNYWNYNNKGTKIAGWTFKDNSITKGTTTLSASADNGQIITYNLEAKGGVIGAWHIGSQAQTLKLYASLSSTPILLSIPAGSLYYYSGKISDVMYVWFTVNGIYRVGYSEQEQKYWYQYGFDGSMAYYADYEIV